MVFQKKTWVDSPTSCTKLTAGELNRIEEGIDENAKAWDSICHSTVADATMVNTSAGSVSLRKIGGVVHFGSTEGITLVGDIPAWDNMQIATLPIGFRPVSTVMLPAVADYTIAYLKLTTDGVMRIYARGQKITGNILVGGSFCVA